MNLPRAICVDLDGCLADHRHRLKYLDLRYDTEYSLPNDGCIHVGFDDYINKEGNSFKKDYDAFYESMDKDGVNEGIKAIVDGVCDFAWGDAGRGEHWPVALFVTGRPEKYRKNAQAWLNRYVTDCPGESHKLFMRPDWLPFELNSLSELPTKGVITGKDGHLYREPDFRPAHEVKREIYENHIKGKYEVLFCLDDSEKCCEMYRSLGITTLKVMI